MKKVFVGLALAGLVFAVAGCGGSAGTPAVGGNVGEINSISDVPTSVVDPSQYDISTNTALSSVSLNPAISPKAVGDLNTFSRAGCETDRMKKNIIRNALLPKMLLCMMGAFEDASGQTAAGDGVFNLWKGSDEMSDRGPPGVAEFKPRFAIKKSGSALTFVMCNDTTKALELFIDTANNEYNGHVINKWGDGFQNQLDFMADGAPLNADGTVGFTTARFTQYMVENSSFWNGFGSETLEATPTYNKVYGFYNEQGTNSYAGSVHARFDAVQGTARYKQDSAGSYPAWNVQATFQNCELVEGTGNCGNFETEWLGASGWLAVECSLNGLAAGDLICFSGECVDGESCCPTRAVSETCETAAGSDHTESFAITLTDAENHVLDFALASTSIYADAVAAATMPVSSVAPTIEFTSVSADVDCSASASWTPLVFTGPPAIETCMAIENEMSDWDTGELCQTLEAAAAGGSSAKD